MFVRILKDTKQILDVTRTEAVYTDGVETDGYYFAPIPEGLDPDCLKTVQVDDVTTVVEDTDKTKAKAVAALKRVLDADVEAQQIALYGTALQTSALATQQTWSDMELHPELNTSTLLPTAEAVTAYVAPKMILARAFAGWRIGRIAQFESDRAAVLNG